MSKVSSGTGRDVAGIAIACHPTAWGGRQLEGNLVSWRGEGEKGGMGRGDGGVGEGSSNNGWHTDIMDIIKQ